MLEQGTVIAGKYRLERPLARGGMGSVWVARHLALDVDVAVKLLVPEHAGSAEARQRFEREARASAQLRSPHVVQVYDFGTTGASHDGAAGGPKPQGPQGPDGGPPPDPEQGSLFLVMELLEGEDLDHRLRHTGRLTPASTLWVVESVGKALERAHEARIVHRDLKPANIFISRQGREEILKVLDFGIAKAMGPVSVSSATRTGTLIGSPHYMSPEQVRRSKDVDYRSDLWSLGVIVYQCLTGRLPFAGDELGDVLVAVCSDEIIPPSRIVPELGPEIDRFIARALTRDIAQRFQSAPELVAAFTALVGAPARGSLASSPFPPGGVGIPMPASGGDTRQIPTPVGLAPPGWAGGDGGLPSGTGGAGVYGGAPPIADSHLAGTPAPMSAGSSGVLPAFAATPPPVVPTGSFPSGTLSPSGSTLVTPRGPSQRSVAIAAGAGALVLGGLAALLVFLSRKPPADGEAVAPGTAAVTMAISPSSPATMGASPPNGVATGTSTPSAASASAGATTEPSGAASAAHAPATIPSGGTPSGTRPPGPYPTPVNRSTPAAGKAPKQAHDPLDHR